MDLVYFGVFLDVCGLLHGGDVLRLSMRGRRVSLERGLFFKPGSRMTDELFRGDELLHWVHYI